LFFFSGFPALIYQLVWQRTLFRIFGVNIESVTIVVTAFMLGLGFGSLLGGWLSKRCNLALLPLLAVIEILTGTFGIFSLAIFDQVGALRPPVGRFPQWPRSILAWSWCRRSSWNNPA
jgi:hypothetical protein